MYEAIRLLIVKEAALTQPRMKISKQPAHVQNAWNTLIELLKIQIYGAGLLSLLRKRPLHDGSSGEIPV
jgi:hypothetical protein